MKRDAALFYMQFTEPGAYVGLALILLVATMLISLRVENSRFGMALLAIKQNEPAAEAAGINTWRWKMLALMLSGALGAMAGGLYAVVLLVVTPETVFGMLGSAQALILRLFGGVDLIVPEGGLYGIIGPNGAGKTTLFNVINGFLTPDRGTISFAGSTLTGLLPNQVCRRGIGRTFQVVRAFPRMTVLENVVVGAFVAAADDAIAARMALAALDRVGLGGRAEAIAGGLTTRELRLMELARALVSQPRLILLDETLAGLGHDDLGGILDVVRQLRSDGTTVVIIEHTMQAMVQLVDHFTLLDHGRLIADAKPADVLRAPP